MMTTTSRPVLWKEKIMRKHDTTVALHETIRLMSEIDKVIDAHGGWPDG